MAEPATVTDSLLDDLDDLSDVVEGNDEEEVEQSGETAAEAQPTDATGFSFRRYLDDSGLNAHLQAIRYQNNSIKDTSKETQDREHLLVVQSNRHLGRLREELTKAHTELCAAYHPRFSELEELIPNISQYKEAVICIKNDLDTAQLNERLAHILSNSQVITITVAASTTSGRILSKTELERIEQIALYIDQVQGVQQQLVSFVEERMNALAPSVCALIGPALAARLMGLAGGLSDLSKIPACNLQVMGQTKQNADSRAGMSIANTQPHQGLLAESELVQKSPKNLRHKALKVVAAKLALAARCDFVNVDTGRPRSAVPGEKFRRDIEKKFHKWEEPDEAPKLKALPKPDLTIKKRRGGRRIRRMKERFEETAMMKQANTRAFSTQAGEYGDDAMGITMGLLDTSGVTDGGAVRKNMEKRKMRQANTKASRKKQAQMAKAASSQNGLASSVVFTPVQGMELVNPDANKDRVREANKKWFSENTGFQSALPKM